MTEQILHVHFFGCSFTAGDELADEIFLPWKFVENHTAESYYEKRNNKIVLDWEAYFKENKLRSYPSLISQANPTIKTYNYAENGKSHRRNILDILRLVEESTQEIDVIYFQLSPPGRDMIIGDDCIHDVLEAHPTQITQEYVLAKLKLSRLQDQSIKDAMDLYMLEGYLKSKNIPFYFLNLGLELTRLQKDIRETILYTDTDTINFDFLNLENLTNVVDLVHINEKYSKLIGNHLPPKQHQEIAQFITKHIKEITSKY
jgi:hypothetical protein